MKKGTSKCVAELILPKGTTVVAPITYNECIKYDYSTVYDFMNRCNKVCVQRDNVISRMRADQAVVKRITNCKNNISILFNVNGRCYSNEDRCIDYIPGKSIYVYDIIDTNIKHHHYTGVNFYSTKEEAVKH